MSTRFERVPGGGTAGGSGSERMAARAAEAPEQDPPGPMVASLAGVVPTVSA